MRGSLAHRIAEATAMLDETVKEASERIFHLEVEETAWEELTLPIEAKNTNAKDVTRGIGLSNCQISAYSAHLAALIDSSDLRTQLLQSKNIDDEVRNMAAKEIRKACV